MARPTYKPTPEQRTEVAVSAGGGMSHEEIALALGISRPTLEKHFRHELTVVAYQKRMEAMAGMHKAAKKGNAAAAKAYLAMVPKMSVPVGEFIEEPEKAPKLGKKEMANAAAVTAAAGTEWDAVLPGSSTPQ